MVFGAQFISALSGDWAFESYDLGVTQHVAAGPGSRARFVAHISLFRATRKFQKKSNSRRNIETESRNMGAKI